MKEKKRLIHNTPPIIPLIGAHLSIKGGFAKAVERAHELHCQTFQFFTKSNRQWYAKKISSEEVYVFHEALDTYNISLTHLFVHASYLINIASSEKRIRAQSIASLKEELERCTLLGIPYLVLHPGAYVLNTREQGIQSVIDALEEVVSSQNSLPMILLENMAGQGSSLGASFEEIATIYNNLSPHTKPHIGMCIDTCHLFSSGYTFTTHTEYQALWNQFTSLLPLSIIKLFHCNDSKTKCGSYIDRHEHIGKGFITLEGFTHLLKDPAFLSIPKIIETPEHSPLDHPMNIELLRKLYYT